MKVELPAAPVAFEPPPPGGRSADEIRAPRPSATAAAETFDRVEPVCNRSELAALPTVRVQFVDAIRSVTVDPSEMPIICETRHGLAALRLERILGLQKAPQASPCQVRQPPPTSAHLLGRIRQRQSADPARPVTPGERLVTAHYICEVMPPLALSLLFVYTSPSLISAPSPVLLCLARAARLPLSQHSSLSPPLSFPFRLNPHT